MLKRNSKCPCGSGKKTKVCHPDLLKRRQILKNHLFHLDTALALNNAEAEKKTPGYLAFERADYEKALKDDLRKLEAM